MKNDIVAKVRGKKHQDIRQCYDSISVASLKHRPIIINCARGGIFDTQAVINALDAGKIANVIVDCWEGEPQLNLTLLEKTAIATPHIAGYSREGKIRATAMALEALRNNYNYRNEVTEYK